MGILSSESLLHKAKQLADNVHQLRNEMIEAVKVNNVAKVSELLKQDATLANASNSKGETAVLLSAYYRTSEIKELLLENGADLNIYEAAAVGHTERVNQLLADAPDLLTSYSADGYSLLGLAAHFGNEETAQLLIEKGADVNARGKDGNLNNMPIHAAIAGNYESIVATLIANGADISARCEGIWRPGYTPLHVAAFFGRESILKLLLQHGAPKTALTDKNESAYDLAKLRGHHDAAALLV